MASIAKLVVTLGANVAGFETDMARASRNQRKRMRDMEKAAAQMGKAVAVGFAVVGGAMVLAVKSAAKFETAMAEVSTLLDDTTGLDKMSDAVKDLSIQYGKMPVEEAKALYQIISAGAKGSATQMEYLTAANKLAVGGLTSVEVAADGLTGVINAYGSEAESAADISDMMFATMKLGKTTIGEISKNVNQLTPLAAQLGVVFGDVGAALSVVTAVTGDTALATNQLKQMFANILAPAEEAIGLYGDLEIQFGRTGVAAAGGLLPYLKQIIEVTGGDIVKLKKLLGSVEAVQSALVLATDDFKNFTDAQIAMAKALGMTDAAAAKVMGTLEFKAAQAASVLENLRIELGKELLAALGDLAKYFVDHMDEMREAVQKFGRAVGSMAGLVVKHLDDIIMAAEVLFKLWVLRFGVTAVRSMLEFTAAAKGTAAAVALIGGPFTIAALAVGAFMIAIEQWYARQEDAVIIVPKLSGLLLAQARAYREVGDAAALAAIAVDIGEKYKALGKEVTASTNAVIAANQAYNDSANLSGLNSQQTLNLKAALEELELHARNVRRLYEAYGIELENVVTQTEKNTKKTKETTKATEDYEKALKKVRKALSDPWRAFGLSQQLAHANELMEEAIGWLDELEAAQKKYEDSLQSILDAADPVGAAFVQMEREIALLTRAYDAGDISLYMYADALEYVASKYGAVIQGAQKAAEETSLLATAIDEGVRIMERAFTDMWAAFLDGAETSFDGVKEGFKTLLASLVHQATTQKIMLNIQQGMKEGFTTENIAAIGEAVAAYAGIILGTKIGGGGERAALGAGIGEEIGKSIGTYYAGFIGGMVGSFLGGLVGGWIGGLFEKGDAVITVSGNMEWAGKSGSDTENVIDSLFGKTYLTSRRIEAEQMAEIAQGIKEFDDAIGGFLDADQIGAITETLADWTNRMQGEAISMEDLLNSRFAAIMSTFSEGIQNFVAGGEDLAAQVERLQVGVVSEKLVADMPELFGGRTLDNFLTVVDAFQTGAMTIGEAFELVLNLLDQVGSAVATLREYADSDLGAEFQALMDLANISLSEAVAGMQSALMDAIAAFDGSPDQLSAIGLMVSTIREGELKLLSEIDAIQKGISANLAQLKADLLGLTEAPKTGEQLFNEAAGLIKSLESATSASEVADIAARFEALIRQMTPEDQARNQGELLRMVGDFDTAQQSVLEGLKQVVIDNAEMMRELVDVFLNDIGPPLDIVAGSNQQAADALNSIAEADLQGHLDNTEIILQTGVDDIAGEVSNIGPVVAAALRQALAGYNVNVAVNLDRGGLVTQ